MYDESRLHVIEMRQPFRVGPFECEAARVTHSIPDCCSLVLRSEHGTIVHTGDWKIDEDPLDGQKFDRDFYEQLGRGALCAREPASPAWAGLFVLTVAAIL
jgi:mRNA degradation ribonuclease J1/J2